MLYRLSYSHRARSDRGGYQNCPALTLRQFGTSFRHREFGESFRDSGGLRRLSMGKAGCIMATRRFVPVSALVLALLCVLLAPRADAKITAHGATVIQAQEGVPVKAFLAYFTTSRESTSPEEINITIDWGDGSVTAGSVVYDGNGRYWVYGDHPYGTSGTYKVKIKIFDPIMGFGTTDMRPGTM